MSDQLRLSDAERETASSALGEHYAQGRIDADEHAERHDRIWAAKTRGEIPAVFADLPGGSPLHLVSTWAATRPAVRPRGGLPFPLKVLIAFAVVALVVTHWPLILIGLGIFWLVSHKSGHGRCAPSSRRYPAG